MAIQGFAVEFGPALREDVLDVIFQITPLDTPAFNMCGDGEAKEVLVQTLQRSIRSRQVNAHIEGETFTNAAGQFPSRQTNHCQIFQKTPTVTGTTQAVGMYGIEDPFLDQMEQDMAGFKTDMDLAFVKGSRLSGQTLDSGGSWATRFMDGIIYWLSRGTLWSRSTDVTLTEQILNDIGQTCWENGVTPRDMLVGATFKRRISGFSGYPNTGFGQIVQVSRPADDFTLAAEIDVYHTDFVDARIFKDRNLGPDASASNQKYLVLFDRESFKKAWLRRPFSARRPYTADSEDGVIISEFTCVGSHTQAGGWFCGQ